MRRLHRMHTVSEHCGLSRAEIYRRIARGTFPRPVPIGRRARAWDADEIDRWIAARISERDADAR